MSRLAIVCALTTALLTLAAFIHHVHSQPLPDPGLPAMPPQIPELRSDSELSPQPSVAAAAAPASRTSPVTATMDKALIARLEERVRREVVAPLQKHWLRRESFSRVRLPSRELKLVPMALAPRAPREERPRYMHFELHDTKSRFTRGARVQVLARVRVDVATEAVEVARTPSSKRPTSGWLPAHKFLKSMDVRLPK